MEMVQIFLYCVGVCSQVDSLGTMDPLGGHVEGSTGSLAHVAQSPFLGDGESREGDSPRALQFVCLRLRCVPD